MQKRAKLALLTILSSLLFLSLLTFQKQQHIDNDCSVSMSHPSHLKETRDAYLHLGLIVLGAANNSMEAFKLRASFDNLIKTIVKFSMRKPIHIVCLTDHRSVSVIKELMRDALPTYDIVNEIDGEPVPQFLLEFVDADRLSTLVSARSAPMRKFFDHGGEMLTFHNYDGKNHNMSIQFAKKYSSPVFYFSPFYHELFPQLKKLIVIDVDVEFQVDIAKLHDNFDKFENDQVMGLANDLAPHYHQMLTKYRNLNPKTELGHPGRFQGLNTGVLLLYLERMRKSELYQRLLEEEEISRMANKYHMTKSFLGAQDWFSLVSFDQPELHYLLDCRFNRQLGLDYRQGAWSDIFELYHVCRDEFGNEVGDGDAFLLHGNSDSLLCKYFECVDANQPQ